MTVSVAPIFDREATSIRAVIPTPKGGHIAMAGFPGLVHDVEGTPYLDPDQMAETLSGLRETGAMQLLVLTEEAELPAQAFVMLREKAADIGLSLTFSAIEDFSVPEASFLKEWPEIEGRILGALARGDTVAVCCQYGAGRSGLITALLLMSCGMSASEAIPLVRSHFSEAIENSKQENWLRSRP